MAFDQIRLGISACLLGERVRFDGGHKCDRPLVESLGRHVEWIPVCPEVESGMDVPREALRLVRDGHGIRLLTGKTNIDRTPDILSFARRRVDELRSADLSGFVLKKDSPSCGLERVKVYGPGGMPQRTGRGLFAHALVANFPLLPIEEEGRLRDPQLYENFVERVFAYRRLTRLFSGSWSIGNLVRFHTAHKLTLMAHQPSAYRALGALVARARALGRRDVEERYGSIFMAALSTIATPPRHVNVLHHMLGYFKRLIDRASRAEILDSIGHYGLCVVPLAVPLTLFGHHVRRCGVGYLAGQTYMRPYPLDLMTHHAVRVS